MSIQAVFILGIMMKRWDADGDDKNYVSEGRLPSSSRILEPKPDFR